MSASFPSSFAQQRLWFIHKMFPQNTAYNMVFCADFFSAIDLQAFQDALADLVARHESLRTSFAFQSDGVIQVLAFEGKVPLHLHDFRGRSNSADKKFAQVLSESISKPFDLSEAPLVRVHLGVFDSSHSRVAIVLHHIIADGLSAKIMLEDLNALYFARVLKTAPFLEPLVVQYADFAVWQRRSLTGKRLERLVAYWKERLKGVSQLELPYDRPRSPQASARGHVLQFTIPAEFVGSLRKLSASSGATLFSTLIAAFAVTIARFTGQSSIAIGTPVSGRPRNELNRVVGLFINSLVFLADISGNPTFAQFLSETKWRWAEDLSHQDLPFDLLVDLLQTKRSRDINPLFQVMFQLQAADRTHAAAGATQVEPEALTSQLDLSLIQYETLEGHIIGGAVYSAELFDPGTIQQIVDAYLTVLESVSKESERHVLSLPAPDLSPNGRFAIAEGERRDWPGPFCLHEWFSEQASKFGSDLAVLGPDTRLSFSELDLISDRLAAELQYHGLRRGQIAAICLARSAKSVIALIGVLKAGGAYLLIDPESPAKWREFIIKDSNVRLVIGLSGCEEVAFGRPFVSIEKINARDGVRFISTEYSSPDDPAYIIYTSGSTGKPKGVLISHRAIVNHMRWMLDRFPIGPGERVLQRTPVTFDASVWEVHAPLLSGASLVLPPGGALFDPKILLEWIESWQVTTLQVVPELAQHACSPGTVPAVHKPQTSVLWW